MKSVVYNCLIFILLLSSNMIVSGQNVQSVERIYLQTDRDIYIAGEKLFFKCFCFDAKTNKPLVMSKYAYVVLRDEYNSFISKICLRLENNIFSGSIYLPDTLITGRYQLVSFTNFMRNEGEQVFFTKEILVANRFDKDLIRIYDHLTDADATVTKPSGFWEGIEMNLLPLTSEKKIYGKREKIRVCLESAGLKDNETVNISISVHEKIPLSGNPETPFNCIENTNIFNTTSNMSNCSYLPEINGVIIKGKVYYLDNHDAIPDATVFLSTPDTFSNLQSTQTNQQGAFGFQLTDYYTGKNIILNLPEINKAGIVLDNQFELENVFKPSRHFPDSLLKDFLIKSQHIVQVQKIYKIETGKDFDVGVSSKLSPPMVYPPVSDAVYPADFISLPDFVEISREILPLLKIREHKSIQEARIFDVDNHQLFDSDPMIFLDGVPINNINQIINLGTEEINKIEVSSTKRYSGNLYFSGILAVFTKRMEINNISWQTPMLSVKYVSLHPASEFIMPNYSKESRLPDFRQLLYWEPSLTLKANEKIYIEFQASDNKGEFEITVFGITSEGKFVSVNSTIKITNLSN